LVVVVLLLHGEKLLYERLDRALRASTGGRASRHQEKIMGEPSRIWRVPGYNVGEESRVERWEEFLQERQGGFGHGCF
jgi:hypothetical protein